MTVPPVPSDGALATTVPDAQRRARSIAAPPRPDVRRDADDARRFGDFTRPIARGASSSSRRRGYRARSIGVGRGRHRRRADRRAVRAAGQGVVPPAGRPRRARSASSPCSTAANAQLAAEVNRLQTPDGIKEAARDEIGFVQRGENRVTVLPAPEAPVDAARPAGRTTRSPRSSPSRPRRRRPPPRRDAHRPRRDGRPDPTSR